MIPKIKIESDTIVTSVNNSESFDLGVLSEMKILLVINDNFKLFSREDDSVIVEGNSYSFCKPVVVSGDGFQYYKVYKQHIKDFFNVTEPVLEEKFFGDEFEKSNSIFDREYYFMVVPETPDEDTILKTLVAHRNLYYIVNLTGSDSTGEILVNTATRLEDKKYGRNVRVLDKVNESFEIGDFDSVVSKLVRENFDNVESFVNMFHSGIHSKFVTFSETPSDGSFGFGEVGDEVTLKKNFFTTSSANQRYTKFFIPPVILDENFLGMTDYRMRFDLNGKVTLLYIATLLEAKEKEVAFNGRTLDKIIAVNSSEQMFFGITEELSKNTYRISTIGNEIYDGGTMIGKIAYIRTTERRYSELEGLVGVETADALCILQRRILKRLVKKYKDASTDNLNSIRVAYRRNMEKIVSEENLIKAIEIVSFGTDSDKRDIIKVVNKNTLYTETRGAEIVSENSI